MEGAEDKGGAGCVACAGNARAMSNLGGGGNACAGGNGSSRGIGDTGDPGGRSSRGDRGAMCVTRVPGATYRLQFNREFTFADAQKLAPYLKDLGITDLYASPLLEARRGSPHGYDVINPERLNPELGDMAAFESLSGELDRHKLGLLLDIVPNHMAADGENPWWRDVLRRGRDSSYAPFFDIDWQPARPGLSGKVLLPVLGSPYGKMLESGELKLTVAEDGLRVSLQGGSYPLSPASAGRLLREWSGSPTAAGSAGAAPGEPPRDNLARVLQELPPLNSPEYGAGFQRAWGLFRHFYNSHTGFKDFVDGQLQALNGRRGDPASFGRLDRILEEQAYRLAFWRTALEEINYRRFFDVTGLVSLRMEDEGVFDAVHGLVFKLVRAGRVTGLRIDHIDGLQDPRTYLCRLQERLSGGGRNFYIIAEKILAEDEELPADWPVCGTTGYDYLNLLNGLFVDGEGSAGLDRAYAQLSETEGDFSDVVYRQKKRVLTSLFSGEMRSLARHLGRLAEQDRHGRDISLSGLEQALVEVTACLPVYRTYIRDLAVPERERRIIEGAVAEAKRRLPAAAFACDFLRRVMLLEFPPGLPEVQQQNWLDFVRRWQQYTGPAMAKGFEDTTLYIYNRLISLNEVGGNPAGRGISVAEFHRRNVERQKRISHTMNATSTHDTKRGEDVRARINVLSELPGAWSMLVKRWSNWNSPRKPVLDGLPAPGAAGEMLIYQTLAGAWPLREEDVPSFRERLKAYVVKAAREAKLRTNWLDPCEAYEGALEEFVTAILEPSPENRFLQDFLEFQKTLAYFGALNALSQVLLKIASPGVPDFYQGTELWTFSLVDPDNRRPVDFGERAALLAALREEEEAGGRAALAKKLLGGWEDGRVKLYLIYKALHLRRSSRKLFENGEYIPVEAVGARRRHVCAFIRRLENSWVLVAAPRLAARLYAAGLGLVSEEAKEPSPYFYHPADPCPGLSQPSEAREPSPCFPPLPDSLLLPAELWEDTALLLPEGAPEHWRNIFTDEEISAAPEGPEAAPAGRKTLPLARLFAGFPAALLTPDRT